VRPEIFAEARIETKATMNHARLLTTLAGLLLGLSTALNARAGDIQKDNIEILSQSGDGRFLLATPKLGQFVVLDSATLEQISPTLEPERAQPAALDYEGARLAVIESRSKLSIFDTKSGRLVSSAVLSLPLRPQTDSGFEVHLLVYSRDGKEIAIVTNELVVVVDVATGKEITRVKSPENWRMPFAQAELNPNKTQLLTTDGGRHPARLWDAHTGKLLRILDDPLGRETETRVAIFSPDGQLMVTGENILEKEKKEYLTAVRIRECRSGRIVLESDLEGEVLALAFSQDGKQLAAAGRRTRVFDITTVKPMTKILHSETLDEITRVAFSPDGKYVMANAPIGLTTVWEVRTQKVVYSGRDGDITSFAGFATVGHVLITCEFTGSGRNPTRTVNAWELPK